MDFFESTVRCLVVEEGGCDIEAASSLSAYLSNYAAAKRGRRGGVKTSDLHFQT